jgi:hypothetical protein
MRRLAAAVLSRYYHGQEGFAEYTVRFSKIRRGPVVWTVRSKSRTSFRTEKSWALFPRCISGFLGGSEGIGANRGRGGLCVRLALACLSVNVVEVVGVW